MSRINRSGTRANTIIVVVGIRVRVGIVCAIKGINRAGIVRQPTCTNNIITFGQSRETIFAAGIRGHAAGCVIARPKNAIGTHLNLDRAIRVIKLDGHPTNQAFAVFIVTVLVRVAKDQISDFRLVETEVYGHIGASIGLIAL